MSALLHLAPVMLALAAAALLAVAGRGRRIAIAVAPWLPLALLLPLTAAGEAQAPVLLLGLRFGVDPVAAPLVVLCAAAWTLAGWFARDRIRRGRVLFWAGWLVSFAGIALALVAQDLGGFYAGYAVLSLASWLLIVHARSAEAHRAGRIYLVLALAGEMAVFAGVMAIAATAGNAALSDLAAAAPLNSGWTWLVLAGFAVKMGIVPLHVWLPLAHPVAPVPASAILSGVIVKAGLLGWLRLVPPGSEAAAAVAPVLVGLGIATAFIGVAIGLTQRRVKVVLAYSTISQMGLVLSAWAAMLMAPEAGVVLMSWLGVLVLHHGLNKAALFLACGCAPGRAWGRGVLIALPALALAAAPLTTGMIAKTGLKTMFGDAGLAHGWTLALSLSSTATALLLWHFWRLARAETGYRTAHPAWIAMTLAGLFVPWTWMYAHGLHPHLLGGLWPATWPLLLAAGLIVLAGRAARIRLPEWPAGDIVVAFERLAARLGAGLHRLAGAGGFEWPNLYPVHVRVNAVFLWAERRMSALPVAGALILGVGGLLWLAAWWG